MEGMPEEPNTKKQWIKAEKIVQLGIMLPAATVIGWAIGSGLDHWLHTRWLSLAGLILGIAAGFVHFVRVAVAAMESKD
jgi:F0F1-type ATP synthase assembly protein I